MVNGPLDWYEFFIWVYYWFTCWIFYWYAPLTVTLIGIYGEVAFTNVSARDLNDYLCEFPSVISGMEVAGLCSAQIKYCAA